MHKSKLAVALGAVVALVAAPLLSEEKESLAEAPKPSLAATAPQQPVRIPPVVAAQAAAAPARVAGWEDAAKRWP